MVEGAPPPGYTLLQASGKLCCDGHAGLLAAVFTTLLFVQCLGLLGANITKLRPEFDPRTHGFKKLSDLIKGHSHAFELQARSASGGAAALYVRHKQPVK
ncbi:hypothetical protein F3J45_00285 [Pantoea sp. Ap-967]|nr:hypothetical protein [Pantoea sp. Ap-967]